MHRHMARIAVSFAYDGLVYLYRADTVTINR